MCRVRSKSEARQALRACRSVQVSGGESDIVWGFGSGVREKDVGSRAEGLGFRAEGPPGLRSRVWSRGVGISDDPAVRTNRSG